MKKAAACGLRTEAVLLGVLSPRNWDRIFEPGNACSPSEKSRRIDLQDENWARWPLCLEGNIKCWSFRHIGSVRLARFGDLLE